MSAAFSGDGTPEEAEQTKKAQASEKEIQEPLKVVPQVSEEGQTLKTPDVAQEPEDRKARESAEAARNLEKKEQARETGEAAQKAEEEKQARESVEPARKIDRERQARKAPEATQRQSREAAEIQPKAQPHRSIAESRKLAEEKKAKKAAEEAQKAAEEQQHREAALAERRARLQRQVDEAAQAAKRYEEEAKLKRAEATNASGERSGHNNLKTKTDPLKGKSSMQTADWFFKQVQELGVEGADIDSSEIAAVLKNISPDEKKALAEDVINGLEDLPANSRAKILLLVTDVASTAKGSQLQKNVAALFAEHPELAEAVQEGAVPFLERNPQFVLEAVSQLSEKDRSRLAFSMEGLGVISEEHCQVFQEAVKPGGLADQISGVLKLALAAYSCRWVLFALAAVELFLTSTLQHEICSVGQLQIWAGGHACFCDHAEHQVHWLFWDSMLNILGSLSFLCTCCALLPCYDKFRADAASTFSGIREIFGSGFSEDSENKTGLDKWSAWTASVAAACAVLFTLLSFIWAIIGVVKLLFLEDLAPCSLTAYFVWACFVILRSVVFAWAAYAVRCLLKETRKLTFMVDGSSYGSMESP